MSTTGCRPCHELFIIYFSEMFVPYRVTVMPRNPFGCGEKMEVDASLKKEVSYHSLALALKYYHFLSLFIYSTSPSSLFPPSQLFPSPLSPPSVPVVSPMNVTVSRLGEKVILVKWQPLTLVEAKGFIEYVVTLQVASSRKRQESAVLTKTASMSANCINFTGVDPSVDYQATVSTMTSDGRRGPGEWSCGIYYIILLCSM